MRALTDRQPPARKPGDVTPGRRAVICAAGSIAGWIVVGAVDHWAPMSQHTMMSADVAVTATALVYALTMPWRRAMTAALVVGLILGGLMYSPAAQDKVAAGWAQASAFIGKHVHRHGGGSGQ